MRSACSSIRTTGRYSSGYQRRGGAARGGGGGRAVEVAAPLLHHPEAPRLDGLAELGIGPGVRDEDRAERRAGQGNPVEEDPPEVLGDEITAPGDPGGVDLRGDLGD